MNADSPEQLRFSLLNERITLARASACTLCLILLLCLPLSGQLGSHSSTPATSQPEVPQEALLLRIIECVESAGVQTALLSQTIFLATVSPSTEAGVEGLLKVPAPRNKIWHTELQ
jgi:hypothetical protein